MSQECHLNCDPAPLSFRGHQDQRPCPQFQKNEVSPCSHAQIYWIGNPIWKWMLSFLTPLLVLLSLTATYCFISETATSGRGQHSQVPQR